MPASAIQGAFTSGELAPSLTARVDLEKYGKGCRTLKNFLVQPHGGAVKRPGFLLLDELPGEACLVPFVFNQTQAYCLVFGERWLRVAMASGFVLNGSGAPYQIESPYTLAQAKALSFCQSADVLFLAVHGVRPMRLMRQSHADWRFEAMYFTAPLPAPEWNTRTVTNNWSEYSLAYQGHAVSGRSERYAYYYVSTEDSGYYLPEPQNLYYKVDKSSTQVVPNVQFINGARKSDGSVSQAQLVTPYSYYVTAVNDDGKESGLSAPANITGPAANNWQAGDYIQLYWHPVAGACEYRVYKASYGGRPCFVASVTDTQWADHNSSPSVTEGAPTYNDPFPDNDFPGAVSLFEQRLVFACSPNRPQTIWMSKSGDYSNFATYKPHTDDAPLELTIASQEVSGASWLAPLRSLIMGTSDMEWEITGRSDSAFSAKTARAKPQSYWGSSLKRALIVGNIILHVSASGKEVRSLQYEFSADSYGGMDLSIMAAHLFDQHRIIDWTYQKSPDSIVWAVREDGVLLGLTFQAEHQISAWHRHDTQGQFKAVCALPGSAEHTLFCVIQRGNKLFLERSAPRFLGGDPARAVFVDSALVYEGAPVQRISGLGHLEGKEVQLLTDGAVHPARKVVNGKIELETPASVVVAGLGYEADLETMPVELAGQGGASVGMKKQINAVDVLFRHSLGVKVGLSFDDAKMQPVKWRTVEAYGKPPAPFSGLKSVSLPALAENSVCISIRSDLPTPVTVLALVSRVQVNQ